MPDKLRRNEIPRNKIPKRGMRGKIKGPEMNSPCLFRIKVTIIVLLIMMKMMVIPSTLG